MHTTGRLMSTVAASPTTANSLEAVLRRHLQHSKGGNVYAASGEHQRLLSGMYCYVKGIATARKDLGLSDTDMLTDEEVERASCTDQKAIIERPICGHIPFKALKETTDAAGNYVNDRYQLRGEKCEEIPLLCTIGCEGSGKTVTLLHTTAAAVHVLEGMVRKRTKNATERKRWRPLGFYVSFAGGNVSIELHKQKFLPMTSIALRVASSVIDDCCATRPKDGMEAAATTAGKKISYEEFATEGLAECKFRWDEETFRGIVAALRAVLAWDGPMFIALDDFEQAYQHKLKKIGEGLRHVSTELLMSDKALPISCNANKQHVKLYETYLAVSACSVADLVAAAPRIGQEQIMQPTPMFDVRNIDTLFAHDSAGMIPSQYASLFNHGPRHLSNEQLLFLIHVFLCAGRPRALSDCLEGHAHDVPGVSFFHPTQQWHDRIIWLRRGVAQLPSARTMKWNFFDACKLVVGLDAETVFSDDDEYHFMDERRRHFVLARDLEEDFVVTQAPTRVLAHGA